MTTLNKDLLSVAEGYLFQCVNCQSAMGSGLALKIKQKWPVVYNEYKQFCNNVPDIALLGRVLEVPVAPN